MIGVVALQMPQAVFSVFSVFLFCKLMVSHYIKLEIIKNIVPAIEYTMNCQSEKCRQV